MMMATGSALRYNLGGREVIAEEFPMAWPLSDDGAQSSCNGEMPQELFAAKQRRCPVGGASREEFAMHH